MTSTPVTEQDALWTMTPSQRDLPEFCADPMFAHELRHSLREGAQGGVRERSGAHDHGRCP
jgi:hypothetical protein